MNSNLPTTRSCDSVVLVIRFIRLSRIHVVVKAFDGRSEDIVEANITIVIDLQRQWC
jgi:hypothetical protein